MTSNIVLAAILALGLVGWFAARSKARLLYSGRGSLHSMPGYHGWYMALWVIVPALLAWAVWQAILPGLVESAVLAQPIAAKLPAMEMERHAILAEAWALSNDPGAAAFNPLASELAGPLSAAQLQTGLRVKVYGDISGPSSGPALQAARVKVRPGRLDGEVQTGDQSLGAFTVTVHGVDDPFGGSGPFSPATVRFAAGAQVEDDASSPAAFFALLSSLRSGEFLEVRVEGIAGASGRVDDARTTASRAGRPTDAESSSTLPGRRGRCARDARGE